MPHGLRGYGAREAALEPAPGQELGQAGQQALAELKPELEPTGRPAQQQAAQELRLQLGLRLAEPQQRQLAWPAGSSGA
jgi:hypothetical protein